MTNKELETRIKKLEKQMSRLNKGICCSISNLKPATDEPKFKVGDKVNVKEAFIGGNHTIYNKVGKVIRKRKDMSSTMVYLIDFDDEEYTPMWINEESLEPYTEPRWTFTDDEKAILRNLPERYKWIARDDSGDLTIFTCKPIKRLYGHWRDIVNEDDRWFSEYNHLFQSIKWEDKEACEFRKFI